MALQKRKAWSGSRLFPSSFQRGFYTLTMLRTHLAQIAALYMDKAKPTVLVDFGCGDRPYRPIFQPYGATYIGADLPDNAAADIVITLGEPLDLAPASVDYVLSSQVLEHVEDPTAYLQECWRILRPDGLLILSTHGHYQYHPHPTDFWRWTAAGLQKIVQDNGFVIQDFHGIGGIGATSVNFFQYALTQNVRFRPLRPLIYFLAQHLMWLLDILWQKPDMRTDALIYLLVARKESEIYGTN